MTLSNKDKIRILVVDDESGMREMLSAQLEAEGFNVTVAKDGLEAVKKVEEDKFNIMICDIVMPHLDGIATLEAVKKIDPELEVIMSTGYGTVDSAVSAMKKGAYDFMEKPYSSKEVMATIEKALERSELKTLVGLYQSSKAVFSTIELNQLLNIVMNLIQKVIQADSGAIFLMDPEGKLYMAASSGMPDEGEREIHRRMAEQAVLGMTKDKQSFILNEDLKRYPEFQSIQANPNIHAWLIRPLICQTHKTCGVLTLNRSAHKEKFTSLDLSNTLLFTSQLTQAVDHAELYNALEGKIKELEKAYGMISESNDQLIQHERQAFLGRRVTGIAHEIKNPLTSVIHCVQLLLESDVDTVMRERLNGVLKEAERCNNVVSDLLSFSRQRISRKTGVVTS